jgi:hypothetical protein
MILIAVTALLEFGPHLRVIKDLAIENDNERSILVRHGLMPTGKVDDAESPVPQRDSILMNEKAAIVRTTVADDISHPL